jgi:hypothetical protein
VVAINHRNISWGPRCAHRPRPRSDCQDQPSRSTSSFQRYPLFFPYFPFIWTPTKNILLFSLSRLKNPPCGEALPYDPGPTKSTPSLTVTFSTISSGYFIDSSLLYPWISLVRVQYVKHEDSILDHEFVGLMVGIELWCQYEYPFKVWLVDLLGNC